MGHLTLHMNGLLEAKNSENFLHISISFNQMREKGRKREKKKFKG